MAKEPKINAVNDPPAKGVMRQHVAQEQGDMVMVMYLPTGSKYPMERKAAQRRVELSPKTFKIVS